MKKIVIILVLGLMIMPCVFFSPKATFAEEDSRIDVADARTIYFIGESFDKSGIKCVYNGFDIAAEFIEVNGFSTASTGETTVKLSYQDISVSYVITVYPQVESIRLISVIHKTSYFVNEKLTVADMKIQLVYKNGERKNINVDARWVKGFDSSVPTEKQTLTIDFGGKTATYDIEVKAISYPENNFVETEIEPEIADALDKALNPVGKTWYFIVWGISVAVLAGCLSVCIIKFKRR